LATLALSPAAHALVQVDKGIAGARVGNTAAEVRAALGQPSQTTSGTNEFGQWTQYRYRRDGITVFFQGQISVTSVSTTGRGDRTRRGVGVGSTEQAVKSRVAGITCETIAGSRTCHTKQFLGGQTLTDFQIRNGKVSRITVGVVVD
jgi:hypothetical protein